MRKARKIRRSRPLALGLGRAYVRRGEKEDHLRAVTLGALVRAADPKDRYTSGWWEGELLILRGILGYADSAQDARGARMAVARCRDYEYLGILERSPCRAEIIRLRERAEKLEKGMK